MQSLPVDVIYSISNFLDIPSLYNLASTCKDMREIMQGYKINDTCDMAQKFHAGERDIDEMYECYDNNYTWYTPHYYLARFLKFMAEGQKYNACETIKRMRKCYNLFVSISYDYRIHRMLVGLCGANIRSCETLAKMKGYRKMGKKQMNEYFTMLDNLKSLPMTDQIYTGPEFVFMRRHPQQL